MKRLSYSNVMATVAVFVALGGTSYAAAKIGGKNVRNGSLTSADVKNNSLRGVDIGSGAVGSEEVRDNSLVAADFQGGQLPVGSQGPKGDKGEKGDKGDPGTPGPANRWLLIDEGGTIIEQSGGFRLISRPGINGQPATNPNYYVDTGSSLVGKGLSASIAIQNRIDRTGDGMADPAFNGEAAVGRCNTAGINCVPAGTNEDDTLVVRSLLNNADVTSQTRRVYVTVTG